MLGRLRQWLSSESRLDETLEHLADGSQPAIHIDRPSCLQRIHAEPNRDGQAQLHHLAHDGHCLVGALAVLADFVGEDRQACLRPQIRHRLPRRVGIGNVSKSPKILEVTGLRPS
jgi:hypothetical protein